MFVWVEYGSHSFWKVKQGIPPKRDDMAILEVPDDITSFWVIWHGRCSECGIGGVHWVKTQEEADAIHMHYLAPADGLPHFRSCTSTDINDYYEMQHVYQPST